MVEEDTSKARQSLKGISWSRSPLLWRKKNNLMYRLRIKNNPASIGGVVTSADSNSDYYPDREASQKKKWSPRSALAPVAGEIFHQTDYEPSWKETWQRLRRRAARHGMMPIQVYCLIKQRQFATCIPFLRRKSLQENERLVSLRPSSRYRTIYRYTSARTSWIINGLEQWASALPIPSSMAASTLNCFTTWAGAATAVCKYGAPVDHHQFVIFWDKQSRW